MVILVMWAILQVVIIVSHAERLLDIRSRVLWIEDGRISDKDVRAKQLVGS